MKRDFHCTARFLFNFLIAWKQKDVEVSFSDAFNWLSERTTLSSEKFELNREVAAR